MKKASKIIAVIMAAMIIFCMVYSAYFTVKNAHHNCTDEDCSICELLQVAETTIKILSTVVFMAVASIFMCILAQDCIDGYYHIFVEDSPIKLKVKLLN